MSSTSLLRKSSEAIFKPNPPPSPQSLDGSSSSTSNKQGMKRAVSQRLTQTSQKQPTRRQSTMSIDNIDLTQFQSKDQINDSSTKDSSLIQQNNNSPPTHIVNRTELFNRPSITIIDSNEYVSEDDLMLTSETNHPDSSTEETVDTINIPLFEHFLVIGVSVDVCFNIHKSLFLFYFKKKIINIYFLQFYLF